MKKIVAVLFFFICVEMIYSQTKSSKYGNYFPPYDTIRFLLVFAEILDTNDQETAGWDSGMMPDHPENYIDYEFNGPEHINSEITKYFYQASFKKLIVIGDYFDTLIKVNAADVNWSYSEHGESNVMDSLHSRLTNDIITKNGFSVNNGDFDIWTPTSSLEQKTSSGDSKIDHLVIIWRRNTRLGSSGGRNIGPKSDSIKQASGANSVTLMIDPGGSANASLLRHEYAHTLVGGNSFHSGGAGAGPGTFLSNIGGYSILSSNNHSFNCINPWDRWRLGWKHDNNTHYISARDPVDTSELYTALVYGQSFPSGTSEFILRDFITYGDAIKIELPYLTSENNSTKRQWLWIVNHQLISGNIDSKSCMTPGLYAHIQVGNNDTTIITGSRTNYMSPVPAFGNFDFTYTNLAEYQKIITSDADQNPLTGYNIHTLMAFNYIDPNGPDYDEIYNKECIFPAEFEYNGNLLDSSKFCYYTFPIFGSEFDAFVEGDKISIGTNPASTPLLTYYTRDRISMGSAYDSEAYDDNRHIFLNGLSVEVIDQIANGDIKVKIRWDDFTVSEDRRWCGDIILNDTIYLLSNKTITIDQGLTPTKPVNPITFNSEKIFADPTKFTCKNNSLFELKSNSVVEVINNSSLILELGSELTIKDGAILHIQSSGTLQIKTGADLNIEGTGQLIVDNGGYLCIEAGDTLNLEDGASTIKLISGYISGLNPFSFSSPGSCDSNPCTYTVTGSGSIVCEDDYSTDTYVQNQTFSSDDYITGRNIHVGYDVTSPPYGNVVINNNAKVVFDAVENITFKNEIDFQSGSEIETRNNQYHFSGKNLSDPLIIGVMTDGNSYTDSRDNDGYENSYTGPLKQDSEDIFYQFTLIENATATISLCNSDIYDSYLHLLDSSGSHIDSNDNCENDECDDELLSYLEKSLSAGTYYIVVEGYGDYEGEITLDLTVDY